MLDVPVIDAAQYIIEPPDLWSERVPRRLKANAPRVCDMPDGGEGWSYDNDAWLRPLGLEVAAGQSPFALRSNGLRYAEIRSGMYDPAERLSDMRIDGIDAALIFPTYGMDVRSIGDAELHVACVRAYNDAVWEWAAASGGRLVPQALIPAVGLDAAVAELARVAAIGFRGYVFWGWPSGGIRPDTADDRFWAACAEAGVVVNLVRGGPQLGADRTPVAPSRYVGAGAQSVRSMEVPFEMELIQRATANTINLSRIVLSGVLDRFPALEVSLVDAGAGWLPTCGELLDWNYRYAQFMAFARLTFLPSEYVRRQVHATFTTERSAVEAIDDLGHGALMWASNYPNSTSPWPKSRAVMQQVSLGLDHSTAERVLGQNCSTLYRVAPQFVDAADGSTASQSTPSA